MRLAIFGGTFDPIHNGHLAMAREAARRCALDRVLFVPAARPPHKSAGPHAPYEDRYRMVELACAGAPAFEASRLEAGTAQSYSIDTIEKVSAGLTPADRLFFLIGADAFSEIESWRRWQEVVKSVEFMVVSRPRRQYAIPAEARLHRLDDLEVPTSSSGVRRKIGRGEFDVDLPPAVLDYIRAHRLYEDVK